jgi:nucleoside 2-deoxyribosyltransferase
MINVYFAGPDVFRGDYARKVEEIRSLAAENGINPLIPGKSETGAEKVKFESKGEAARFIYGENIDLIRRADGVIANLNPFRGVVEPDSGTVFEVGYATALNKWVIGYLDDLRDLTERIKDSPLGAPGGLDREGNFVEDLGCPVNLMLAESVKTLVRSLKEAVLLVKKL